MSLRELWTLVADAAIHWYRDNTFRLSAALAFYTLFSMAPILLIATAVAGVWFGEAAAVQQVLREMTDLVGPQGTHAVRVVLEHAHEVPPSRAAAAFGIAIAVLGSTAVFVELQSALNQIWGLQAPAGRGYLLGIVHNRLLSFAIVLGVGILLLVSLVLSALLSGVQELMAGRMEHVPAFWRALNLASSFLLTSALFAMIYKYLPDVRLTWRDVAIGAFVTAALFTAGKDLIGLYLGRIAFSSLYGAAGSFVVLLLWVYCSALICFYGAEFTQVYAQRYGSRSRVPPQPPAARIDRKPADPAR